MSCTTIITIRSLLTQDFPCVQMDFNKFIKTWLLLACGTGIYVIPGNSLDETLDLII